MIKELKQIPDFIEALRDLEKYSNCDDIGKNTDLFKIHDESILFFPTLKNIKIRDLEDLEGCELLALRCICNNQKNKILDRVDKWRLNKWK